MMAGKRTRLLQTLTTAQLDRRRIDRQLRVLELRTIKILRGLGLEKPDQWKGDATPSEAQLAHLLLRADLWIAKGQTHASTRDLRPTDKGIRAFRAVHALIQIRDARTHLDDNNAPRAVYAAIQAAVFGGDLLMHAVTVVAGRQRGGRTSAAPYRHAEQLCQEKIADLLEAGPSLSVSCIADHILRTTLADVTLPGKKPRPVSKRTVRTWIRRRKLETAKR